MAGGLALVTRSQGRIRATLTDGVLRSWRHRHTRLGYAARAPAGAGTVTPTSRGGVMRKLLVAVGLLVVIGSAQAQFCPGVSPWVFDDVLASDSFCPDITWMALNNITLGCKTIDPLNRDYCPNDSVTRKQMAAFMYRLGTIRVQEVDTGLGLTGGPITLTGTIGLTATQLLPTTAWARRQVPKWNGSTWTCATVGGTGTVTSVTGGTGLVASPSPITTSGTLNLALSYQLPQGCSNG